METFVKDFFLSEACEYNNFKMPSRVKAAAEKESQALFDEIKSRLNTDEKRKLERYVELLGIIEDENDYYAFICGARMALKVLIEIFCTC